MNKAPNFCGECGSPLEQETRFCGECGTPTADHQENSHNVSTDSREPEPEKVTEKVSANNDVLEPKIERIENKNTLALWSRSIPVWGWVVLTLLLFFVLLIGGISGFSGIGFLAGIAIIILVVRSIMIKFQKKH